MMLVFQIVASIFIFQFMSSFFGMLFMTWLQFRDNDRK